MHARPTAAASLHSQAEASMAGRQLPQSQTGLVAEEACSCATTPSRQPGVGASLSCAGAGRGLARQQRDCSGG